MTNLAKRALIVLRRDGIVIFVRKAIRFLVRRITGPSPLQRDINLIRASEIFSEAYYLTQAPELKGRGLDLIRHFLQQGAAKGLNPHPLFETAFYLKTYPDVARAAENPLLHYLKQGAAEGRMTSPGFDGGFYLDEYPDVKRAGINPLRHYIVWGAMEYRRTTGSVDAPNGVRGYSQWVATYDGLSQEDRGKIAKHIDSFRAQPRISVLMPVYNTPEKWLRAAIESVRTQLYPNWELCIGNDGSTAPHVRSVLDAAAANDDRIKVVHCSSNGGISAATNSALSLAGGEYVTFLDHDDELNERALYMVAAEVNAHPDADLIYSDEDKIDEDGQRQDPYFKPDWDPDLILAENYVCHLTAIRTGIVRNLGGLRREYDGSQDHDLVLRVSEIVGAERTRHIPFVLYHWRIIPGSTAFGPGEKPNTADVARKAIREHLKRRDIRAKVSAGKIAVRTRITYEVPAPAPLVSILIPTRDRLDLVRSCVDSIESRTDYPNYEMLILDNDSTEPETLAYFESLRADRRVRVLPWRYPFSFSAINNFGAQQARGDLLCLMNNDIEVQSRGWLAEMVGHAVRPDVGIVGAKLYYPDGRIQHAGVILGIGGVAGHIHKYLPADWPGRMGHRALVAQTLSAVTAACIVLRKELYDRAGGLDENLKFAFNDVDFCIRLRNMGYRNIFTPYAELIHKESASRGHNETPEKQALFEREIRFMRSRWGKALMEDPYYNPNLTLSTENEALAMPPRTVKPWMEFAN